MEILKIPFGDAKTICDEWERITGNCLEIETIRSFCTNDKIECLSVKHDVHTCALFEIRNAPSHIKNMTILLNPDIDMDTEGDLNTLVTRLDFIVQILSNIFKHLIEEGLSSRELVKIRNDREFIRTAFVMFAKHLKKESEVYSVVFIKEWIHISRIETKGEAS